MSNKPALITRPFTYHDLKEYHLKRIKFDKDNNERPPSVLRNHRSVINSWARCEAKKRRINLPDKSDAGDITIGEEIASGFVSALPGYQKEQIAQGKQKGTVADRTTIMWSVHESAIELLRSDGLPASFPECLTRLVSLSGKSQRAIAAAVGVSVRGLQEWMYGTKEPELSSKPIIERLEEVLKAQEGTLTGRVITFQVMFLNGPIPSGSTEWREHQRKVGKVHYRLKESEVSSALRSEFNDLFLFYTDDEWLEEHGLERNSEWRIRPNKKCATRDMVWRDIRSCFGHFRLQPGDDNSWLSGLGIPVNSLSLALLSDAQNVISFLKFKRSRTHLESYTNESIIFLSRCRSWLKEGTGFLRQQPEYGSKLPVPVPPDKWDEWCEKNREQLRRFRERIRNSKNHGVRQTRDPFAGVRNLIEERDHPLSALLEMTHNMKRLIPIKARGTRSRYAVFMRDLTFGEFSASYPMRIENFSGLKWVPKDHDALLERYKKFLETNDPADLLPPDQKYIETEPSSNLFQKTDGSFWVRYAWNEVKNGVPIDVPVSKSVTDILLSYLTLHRIVLNEEIKSAINTRRMRANRPVLGVEEEIEIDRCPYVFRPFVSQVFRMTEKAFAAFKGTEQVPNEVLSGALYRMSRRYIPNCLGFHAHSVRHLVASEYIKNHPDNYAAAAAALNISIAVVKKHYAWVPPCTKLKPWHDHFESLRKQFESSLEAA